MEVEGDSHLRAPQAKRECRPWCDTADEAPRPSAAPSTPAQVDPSLYVLLSKALAGRPRHRDLEKAEVEVRTHMCECVRVCVCVSVWEGDLALRH